MLAEILPRVDLDAIRAWGPSAHCQTPVVYTARPYTAPHVCYNKSALRLSPDVYEKIGMTALCRPVVDLGAGLLRLGLWFFLHTSGSFEHELQSKSISRCSSPRPRHETCHGIWKIGGARGMRAAKITPHRAQESHVAFMMSDNSEDSPRRPGCRAC